MKTMKIKYMGIEVKVHNKREEKLVRILNDDLERYLERWDEEDWRESFLLHEGEHWMYKEADGLLTAMYFMGLIDGPTTSDQVFRSVRDAWTEREVA